MHNITHDYRLISTIYYANRKKYTNGIRIIIKSFDKKNMAKS